MTVDDCFIQIDFLILFDVFAFFSFVMQHVTFHVQITVLYNNKDTMRAFDSRGKIIQ